MRYSRTLVDKSILLGIFLAATLAVTGCGNDPYVGEHRENKSPQVWLSAAPPEGSTSTYRVHLYWGGWDPDGEVAYYEYAITNNESGIFDPADTTGRDNWYKVYSNDSAFTFTADQLADTCATSLITEFQRSHTFFIRAVDEEGLASEEPDYRSFTALTLSPSVRVLVPRRNAFTPAFVPPITTFRWEAVDYINTLQQTQDPDSVRWILHPVEDSEYGEAIDWIRQNPQAPEWSDWHYYRAPLDSGKFWTTRPVDFGSYVFAIQAKDEAGAVTPVFDEVYNVRRLLVSKRTTGPLLSVSNEFMGSVVTKVVSIAPIIMDLPAGVPMAFRWSANADDYGGIVSGYRYGWDIADLTDDHQWEVDYTPFTAESAMSPAKRFFFGVHTFTVEVQDNSGARSRIEVKVNIIQFTMHKNLLLVDDYREIPGASGFELTKGAIPSDEEHDEFWFEMLDEVEDFSTETDVLEVRGGQVFPITLLAQYKAIIWDVLGGYDISASIRPLLSSIINFRSKDPSRNALQDGGGKVQPNMLALFMAAGGKVLLCGSQPLTQSINSDFFGGPVKFPFVFKYELEGDQSGDYSGQIDRNWFVGDQSFGYRDACVNTIDVALPTYSAMRRKHTNGCGVVLIRTGDPVNDGLRECMSVDDPAFPSLTLRPEVSSSGRHFAPDHRGINSELYNPPYFDFCRLADTRECFEPIYGHGCLNSSSSLYGAPVAFWSSQFADVVPVAGDNPIAARSAFFGFEPVFFNPDQVKLAIDRIVFGEWELPRKPPNPN